MKNTSISLLVTFLIAFSSTAQQVVIKKSKNRIASDNVTGIVSAMIGGEEEIEDAWYKELRGLGRLREEGNYLTVKEAELPAWADVAVPVYSKITASDSLSEIWIGFKELTLSEDSISLAEEQLNTFLYNFSLNFYKAKAQTKIDEANRAVTFTKKKHQDLLDEAFELKKDSISNSEEIQRLKDLLEKNLLEEKVINQKIIDNKTNQKTTEEDIIRLEKMVEQRKEKKKAIE